MPELKTGRNDPCPCGSGQKYKNCHLGREGEASPEVVRRSRVVPAIMSLFGLGVALAAGAMKSPGAGWTVAAATALFVGGYLILRDPPAGDPKRKDTGTINFGG